MATDTNVRIAGIIPELFTTGLHTLPYPLLPYLTTPYHTLHVVHYLSLAGSVRPLLPEGVCRAHLRLPLRRASPT